MVGRVGVITKDSPKKVTGDKQGIKDDFQNHEWTTHLKENSLNGHKLNGKKWEELSKFEVKK